MRIHVLGSAAGGGFPQWNCNCYNCHGLRRGEIKATARTQSSIAISGDGVGWVLTNASPDIRTQLEAFPAMQPARAIRDTGITGIVLMDSQIDHTTGLLILREGQPLDIYCTDMVHQDLTTGNPLFNILGHYCGVNWHDIPLDEGDDFVVRGADQLRFHAVPLDSKAPPYSPHRHDPHLGDNIGMWIEDDRTEKRLFYAPGLGHVDDRIRAYLAHADCLLVDGTFWRDDELIQAGIVNKRARDMGHLAQSGPGGMISVLSDLERPRKILIHINNTNPILNEDSPERAALADAGIEVAYDGMDIEL
ncbi:MAG: pyrroloquinoline quinone biosynthesis protein PqqB [Candidatus Entotheonella gemina]|uniref:Coenzyme PQQ synthesis protein B n=1 Tax=Candidatus Entotheonella gemina TaxID=1429439 RepID=W4M949_9BACT|nr:MAG: pyrroloquinoline quinone biosynthesis protein PqqB [Candidatus Entotheonella gemina]